MTVPVSGKKPRQQPSAGIQGGNAPAQPQESRALPAHKAAPTRTGAPTFPVVGVGASAGGLEAFTQLLKALPAKPGMAFVLVAHLDPTHESAMAELLGRATAMPVFQVNDGMRLKPDQVYVIPPNRAMTIQNGLLRLVTRSNAGGLHMPVDTLFRSLASELHS